MLLKISPFTSPQHPTCLPWLWNCSFKEQVRFTVPKKLGMQEFEVPFRYFLVWEGYMIKLLISSKTMFLNLVYYFVSIFHIVSFQASYSLVPSLLPLLYHAWYRSSVLLHVLSQQFIWIYQRWFFFKCDRIILKFFQENKKGEAIVIIYCADTLCKVSCWMKHLTNIKE